LSNANRILSCGSRQFLVPEGHARIAQRFSVGVAATMAAKSRRDDRYWPGIQISLRLDVWPAMSQHFTNRVCPFYYVDAPRRYRADNRGLVLAIRWPGSRSRHE